MRGSLALAKRLISNLCDFLMACEGVRDDKWNKKFAVFAYILNGVNRGALSLVFLRVTRIAATRGTKMGIIFV